MTDAITNVSREDEGTVVRLEGEIDLNRSPAFHESLLDICEDHPKRLIVNLSKVDYIDSSGVGALVDAYRRLKRDGAQMILVAPSERVQGILEITRLDQFFQIAQTEKEAMKA